MFSKLHKAISWETSTYLRLHLEVWLILKQGLLTMQVLKFGETSLMILKVTFGL